MGVIPEDWEVKSFGELFEFRNGVNADKASYGQGVRFINVLEPITYSHIYGPEITGQVSLPEPVAISYAVRRGDVLLNRTSETQEELGLAATYLGTERVVFGGFVIRGRPTDQSLDPIYSGYALRAPIIRSQIIPMGQGAVRANIGQQSLRLVVAPVPPTPEQQAIAEALSDTDALIESLEKLIAKKRQIKQGAMQELLTGKRRLAGVEIKPGYKQSEVGVIPADWEVKLLPEVCRFRGGKAHEQYFSDFGPFVCVNSKFISTDGKVRKYSSKNLCCAKRGDILMVMSDLPNGRALAKAFLVDQNQLYAVNQRVCALTPYRDCSTYLFCILNRNPYFLKFDDGVNQTHLLNPVFHKCLLPVPPTITEQEAIATILSDMDSEVTSLETKLTKARQIKQGMMQELLTGRIRLI
ncbi:MAG: restriction endonuclease subunit S [Desulfobacterales bacterium]|nr:restriction endonuclease subunit S [Desulfobacterales bacterium]